jgi:nicotinamidase-related amidase
MQTIQGRLIPETLEELLTPSASAHVVIDFQNDFCHPDGIVSRTGADVSRYPATLANVRRLIQASRALGVLQIFVKFVNAANGASDSSAQIRLRAKLAKKYSETHDFKVDVFDWCDEGTWGAELLDEIKDLIRERDIILTKRRASAFFGTDLDILLRARGIQTVLFTGCATEGCLEASVRDAAARDYFTVVLEDGVNSESFDLHQASLAGMRAYRSDVVTVDAAILALKHAARPALISSK